MIIPGKVYDVLKWLLLIVTPAFEVCLKIIVEACGLAIPVDTVNTVISAVATFIGVCIGISNKNYYLDEE